MKKTSLEIVTKIFLKIHSVYKDASKERQQRSTEFSRNDAFDNIRGSTNVPANQVMRSMSIAMANSGRNILPPQVGSSRLSTAISEKSEDKNRIFSGEVIIFQHEMVQLFSDIMDADILSYTYVKSVLLEYIRCLQEFSLPAQPRLQTILWNYVCINRDFIGLQNLLQYKVLGDSLELAQYLIKLGTKKQHDASDGLENNHGLYDSFLSDENPRSFNGKYEDINSRLNVLSVYYEPAFDFGLNMLFRLRHYRDVFLILYNDGLYAKALDFAKRINVDAWVKYSDFKSKVEQMPDSRAKTLLMNRINVIKSNDEKLLQTVPGYRSFFEDIVRH